MKDLAKFSIQIKHLSCQNSSFFSNIGFKLVPFTREEDKMNQTQHSNYDCGCDWDCDCDCDCEYYEEVF